MSAIFSAVTGWFTSSSWAVYAAIGAVVVAIVTLMLFRMTSQAQALGKSLEQLDQLKETINAKVASDRAGAVPTDRRSTARRLSSDDY